MFTRCLRIFSSRSLLWRKSRKDGVCTRRLKAGEKNRAEKGTEGLHNSRTELAALRENRSRGKWRQVEGNRDGVG